jgi:hypothetical protein
VILSWQGLAASCGATGTVAQDEPRPSLGGHTFVPTDLVPDAFVRTTCEQHSTRLRGSPEHRLPARRDGNDTLEVLSGSLTYATLGLEYQAKLRDWIATRIGAGLVTRLGTQGSSGKRGRDREPGLRFSASSRSSRDEKTMLQRHARRDQPSRDDSST